MSALERALHDPPQVPRVEATSALTGLDRRRVSPLDILAQSVAAIGPSSGALVGTVAAAQVAGRGVWLSVLIGVCLAWMLAQVFGQFASRLAGAGSLYTFVARAVGPWLSLIVLVSLIVGYTALAGFGLTQTADHLIRAVRPDVDAPSPALGAIVIVVVALVALLVMTRGVRISTRVTLVAELAGIALLIVLIGAAVFTGTLPTAADFSLDGADAGSILAGAGIMAGAMLGFESSTALGAEASRPLASVPRAMTRSVLFSGTLFLLVVLAGATSPANDSLADGERIWLAQGPEFSAVIPLLHAVLALCFFPVALATWSALSRLLFVTARDGIAPAWLGALDQRARVPRRAMIISTPLVLVIPVITAVIGADAGAMDLSFEMLATPLMMLAYAITCFAVPVFLRRIGEQTVGWTTIALTAGATTVVFSVIDLLHLPPTPRMIGLLAVVAVVSSTLIWCVLRRPDGTRWGSYDQTTTADVWSGI